MFLQQRQILLMLCVSFFFPCTAVVLRKINSSELNRIKTTVLVRVIEAGEEVCWQYSRSFSSLQVTFVHSSQAGGFVSFADESPVETFYLDLLKPTEFSEHQSWTWFCTIASHKWLVDVMFWFQRAFDLVTWVSAVWVIDTFCLFCWKLNKYAKSKLSGAQ